MDLSTAARSSPVRKTQMRIAPCTSAALLVLAACTGDDLARGDAVRSQRGDTLVLQIGGEGRWGREASLREAAAFGEADGSDTAILGQIVALAVGPDDRVYATDRQRLGVRVFDAELRAIGIWGRDGSGPGELRNPDGGLAVFSNGRVAVRDPGNARLQLFGVGGGSAGEWRVVDAGLRTRENFGRQGDTLLSRVVVRADGPIDSWVYGLMRIAPDGRVLDTLSFPLAPNARPSLVARRGGNTAQLPVPFSAGPLSAWHPRGGFATAQGDTYAITWPRDAGQLRVERSVAAVAVSTPEAAQERAYVTKGLQWLDPAWVWTGPEIPSSKPMLSSLFVGTDGSVWALREGDAVDGEDPDYRPNDASSVERRLRSQLSLDAFTADGDFLGTIALPAGLQLQPLPVFSESGIVALALDAAGVPRVARYIVETPAPR